MKIELDIPTVDLSWIKISHIILVSAILRFFIMPFPSDGGMIFDEVHYIKAVRAMMSGVAANAEHPPLTKIIGIVSISVFGDHWFGWRLPIIICSLVSTYLLYKIAREFLDERLSLLVSSFMIFDIIFFIHGNIFMLETPALMFGLAFVLYYLRGKPIASASFMGLAFLCNEKALFILLGLSIYHVLTHFNTPTKKDAKKVGMFLLICIIVGGGGLWTSDLIWKPSKATQVNINVHHTILQDEMGTPISTETATHTTTTCEYIENPISHVMWMVKYYTSLNEDIETPAEDFRPPWTWIAPFGNWNNPPKYLVTAVTTSCEGCPDKTFLPINYRAQTPVFIWFMTVPIIGLALYSYKDRESKFILSWIAGTFGPWFIWELQKMNMPFNHYFMFTAPVICFGIPWFWDKIGGRYKYPALAAHLSLVIVHFFMYFPVGVIRNI